MPELKILNSKEIKKILKLIENQWNAKLTLKYAFLQNNKNRIFIVNKDLEKIELEKLRFNSIGMYFCEINDQDIRLSIEGSQLIGPTATKNIVEINKEQTRQWFKGEDLEIKGNYSGFLIIKHNNDFLGSGKYKEGRILNYVSKSRRVNVNIWLSSNLIFKFELYQSEINDHDFDGVPSYLEDIDGDGEVFNDDTDEDEIPDYADQDDDGDGTLTVEEDLEDIDLNVDSNGDGDLTNDLDGDGDPTNDDTDGDGIPNYLDTDNTESNKDDDN